MVPAGWVGRAGQGRLQEGEKLDPRRGSRLGRRAERVPVSEWKTAEAGMHKAHTA